MSIKSVKREGKIIVYMRLPLWGRDRKGTRLERRIDSYNGERYARTLFAFQLELRNEFVFLYEYLLSAKVFFLSKKFALTTKIKR